MKILQEDYDLAKARSLQIKQELRNLAEEFKEVLGQSSETWHDNAPWDDAKSREKLLLIEQYDLQKILVEARIEKVDSKSLIGKKHKVNYNGRDVYIYLAGDFTMRTGQKIDDHVIVSLDSPIAQTIIAQ
ncbi:MAG: hypothetical protein QG623_208 [Patescibacteria group bacterium]|nr:hypothetical protein [Patescibacteria group bacterium]